MSSGLVGFYFFETWNRYLFWCVNNNFCPQSKRIQWNIYEYDISQCQKSSGIKMRRKSLFTISSDTGHLREQNTTFLLHFLCLRCYKSFLAQDISHGDSKVNRKHIISEFIWAILSEYSTWTMNRKLTWVVYKKWYTPTCSFPFFRPTSICSNNAIEFLFCTKQYICKFIHFQNLKWAT